MASSIYTPYKLSAIKGSIAILTDTINIALLTSSYTPNVDTHAFFSDVNGNESSGSGYSAGGIAMTSKTVTQDSTNHRGVYDADDAQWPSSTIANARYAVIYKNTGTPSTSPLIGVIDLGGTKTTSGDTFYIQFDVLGIFYIG